MYKEGKYSPIGDKGIVVKFGKRIQQEINVKIRSMALIMEEKKLPGITELVPTYCSLTIYYDPLRWKYDELLTEIKKIETDLESYQLPQPSVVFLPVAYGGEYGPDLEFVSMYTKLSQNEVIDLHTKTDYLIYMLGFAPGFPYLGGMNEILATPRLEIPRTKIPAGSVGIAGSQTGIYPIDSPAGWRIIGRTPVRLYDPHRQTPVLLKAGDYIRFYEITPVEYEMIAEQEEKGQYQVEWIKKENPHGFYENS